MIDNGTLNKIEVREVNESNHSDRKSDISQNNLGEIKSRITNPSQASLSRFSRRSQRSSMRGGRSKKRSILMAGDGGIESSAPDKYGDDMSSCHTT